MNDSFYLPMDCPNCGRRRLLVYPDTQEMRCEKCGVSEFDCSKDEHEAGGTHPQHSSKWWEWPDPDENIALTVPQEGEDT
jgi:predicted  nucleic acid-binding Zn-ribbon protein